MNRSLINMTTILKAGWREFHGIDLSEYGFKSPAVNGTEVHNCTGLILCRGNGSCLLDEVVVGDVTDHVGRLKKEILEDQTCLANSHHRDVVAMKESASHKERRAGTVQTTGSTHEMFTVRSENAPDIVSHLVLVAMMNITLALSPKDYTNMATRGKIPLDKYLSSISMAPDNFDRLKARIEKFVWDSATEECRREFSREIDELISQQHRP